MDFALSLTRIAACAARENLDFVRVLWIVEGKQNFVPNVKCVDQTL